MAISAYAPASIGNVSLGFDLLGAAIKPIDGSLLGDEVEVTDADEFGLEVKGVFADKLPSDPEQNIVSRCYRFFHQKLATQGKQPKAAKLTLHKHLPIGSGLGSSAASIVAALHGLNQFYGEPFSSQDLLLMMGELEGQISGSVHFDNVAPSYLGGLTLMAEHGHQVALSLPTFEHWYWVVCYSGINVSTAQARAILPKEISLRNTLTFGRQMAVFVDACYRQDEALAVAMMKDVIAEPYRKSMLPGFDQARTAVMDAGSLAFGISGSGPTVFAVCQSLDTAKSVNQYLQQHYIQNALGFSHICQLDMTGARVRS